MSEAFEYFEHPILSEEDMANLKIQPGVYPMETFEATPMFSKSANNPMIMLKMHVYDNNGKSHTMTDFLVAIDSMAYKTKNFWKSVGYPERYQGKNKVSDYTNRKGYVSVKPQKNKLSGETENKIVDYIVKESPLPDDLLFAARENFIEDDVPF